MQPRTQVYVRELIAICLFMQEKGVHVFPVGIGAGVDQTVLQGISGSKETFSFKDDNETLLEIEKMKNATCSIGESLCAFFPRHFVFHPLIPWLQYQRGPKRKRQRFSIPETEKVDHCQ